MLLHLRPGSACACAGSSSVSAVSMARPSRVAEVHVVGAGPVVGRRRDLVGGIASGAAASSVTAVQEYIARPLNCALLQRLAEQRTRRLVLDGDLDADRAPLVLHHLLRPARARGCRRWCGIRATAARPWRCGGCRPAPASSRPRPAARGRAPGRRDTPARRRHTSDPAGSPRLEATGCMPSNSWSAMVLRSSASSSARRTRRSARIGLSRLQVDVLVGQRRLEDVGGTGRAYCFCSASTWSSVSADALAGVTCRCRRTAGWPAAPRCSRCRARRCA